MQLGKAEVALEQIQSLLQDILHRVVDVFEKLTVDSLIDWDRHSIRINEKDRDFGFTCNWRST